MSDVAIAARESAEIDRFLADPLEFFGSNYTEMHSVPRDQLEQLQRQALAARFEQQRERIPMVAKLAERQKINSIDSIEQIARMLFEHTMYKSYPLALLERRQFDRVTTWLDKLTAVDLSAVDASGCDSIDAWLDALVANTDVDVAYSSGTSGTMTYFPWSRRDLELRARSHRITDLQVFGQEPLRTVREEPIHFVGAPSRHRGKHYNAEAITCGDASHMHISGLAWPSADLLWLAARLRLAAVRGDVSRVEVPEQLLARRAELERNAADAQTLRQEWISTVASLQGQPVLWMIYAHELHQIASQRLAHGERWSFAPGSTIMMAGGTKGQDLPADWMNTLHRFLDIRITEGYGMTEMSCVHIKCEHGNYHVQPWVIPLVMDEETSALLPREGVQTGRSAFFDLLPKDHWGGVMTGDEITVDYSTPCPCGQTSVHIGPEIGRIADKRGGDDKINCAATPQAHAEAMDFLVGY